jgi:hypothetical protein
VVDSELEPWTERLVTSESRFVGPDEAFARGQSSAMSASTLRSPKAGPLKIALSSSWERDGLPSIRRRLPSAMRPHLRRKRKRVAPGRRCGPHRDEIVLLA